jgi:alkylhydroperoxidase/carboxymuconolactone decarboxylase family protein YurZ
MPLQDDRAEARDGYAEALDAAASGVDPSFADAYLALWRAAARREALSAADRELIGLAVNAAVTHLNLPAVRLHIDRALDAGATTQQIVEVLELVSVLGIHTLTAALPIVLEELGGQEPGPLSCGQETLKQAFLDLRGGPWAPAWDPLLRADSPYFEAYTRFSGVPWGQNRVLSPKFRELVYAAIDASTTHLWLPGLRSHVRKAIGYGATLDELLEVLELTSLIGVQSFVQGTRALLTARRAGAQAHAADGTLPAEGLAQ